MELLLDLVQQLLRLVEVVAVHVRQMERVLTTTLQQEMVAQVAQAVVELTTKLVR